MKTIMRNLTILLLLQALLVCCSTKTNLQYNVQKHNERTITIESLRNEIWKDSTHYKIVMFYDPWCPPCVMNIDSFVQPLLAASDTSIIRFWLISENHLFEDESDAFLEQHGISNFKVINYNLNDTCSSFSCLDYNQWDNVTNYLFPRKKTIHGLDGLPFYLIASKDNCLFTKDSIDAFGQKLHLPLQLYELHKDPNLDFCDNNSIIFENK